MRDISQWYNFPSMWEVLDLVPNTTREKLKKKNLTLRSC